MDQLRLYPINPHHHTLTHTLTPITSHQIFHPFTTILIRAKPTNLAPTLLLSSRWGCLVVSPIELFSDEGFFFFFWIFFWPNCYFLIKICLNTGRRRGKTKTNLKRGFYQNLVSSFSFRSFEVNWLVCEKGRQANEMRGKGIHMRVQSWMNICVCEAEQTIWRER